MVERRARRFRWVWSTAKALARRKLRNATRSVSHSSRLFSSRTRSIETTPALSARPRDRETVVFPTPRGPRTIRQNGACRDRSIALPPIGRLRPRPPPWGTPLIRPRGEPAAARWRSVIVDGGVPALVIPIVVPRESHRQMERAPCVKTAQGDPKSLDRTRGITIDPDPALQPPDFSLVHRPKIANAPIDATVHRFGGEPCTSEMSLKSSLGRHPHPISTREVARPACRCTTPESLLHLRWTTCSRDPVVRSESAGHMSIEFHGKGRGPSPPHGVRPSARHSTFARRVNRSVPIAPRPTRSGRGAHRHDRVVGTTSEGFDGTPMYEDPGSLPRSCASFRDDSGNGRAAGLWRWGPWASSSSRA